jgi:hypothetical protein
MDIQLKDKYIFDSNSFSSVNEFFEHVILEETGGTDLPPKHLGDVEIDNNTLIDVKSINVAKKFHMPNLASQNKLYKWLQDEQNTLMYLLIFYEKDGINLHIKDWSINHIEEFDPECLVVQAQGLGALQIKNVKNLKFVDKINRKKWLHILKSMVESFLLKEEKKIEKIRKMYKRI